MTNSSEKTVPIREEPLVEPCVEKSPAESCSNKRPAIPLGYIDEREKLSVETGDEKKPEPVKTSGEKSAEPSDGKPEVKPSEEKSAIEPCVEKSPAESCSNKRPAIPLGYIDESEKPSAKPSEKKSPLKTSGEKPVEPSDKKLTAESREEKPEAKWCNEKSIPIPPNSITSTQSARQGVLEVHKSHLGFFSGNRVGRSHSNRPSPPNNNRYSNQSRPRFDDLRNKVSL